MKIKWYGHACFEITSKDGTKILTDPFDETVGYEVPHVEADIVTSSHDHFDHNAFKNVKGDFVKVTEPGRHVIKGIEINGVETFHDSEGGKKRGKNVAFTYNVDGIKICHLGDLGHVLTDEQVKKIGDVDILLIPVGGNYTIGPEEAAEIVEKLNPKMVIPMHFKTKAINFPIEGVDRFLEIMGEGVKLGAQFMDIEKEQLPDDRTIVVMNYEYDGRRY